MSVDRARGWIAPIFLVLCLVLGGASAPSAGVPANLVLQVLSVFLILFCILTRRSVPFPDGSRTPLVLAGLWVLLALLYLVPLPPGIWTSLPGRESVVQGFQSLGAEQPALPVSLSRDRSISSLLGILPPLAMFLVTLQLSSPQRRRLAITFIAAAAVALCLGAAQLASGPRSSLRPYAVTNPDMSVGFFANGNHQATLLLCALALSGFLLARAIERASSKRKGNALAGPIMLAIFLTIGVGLVGALAGFGLLLVVAAGLLLMHRRARVGKIGAPWAAGVGVLVVVMIGFALTGPFVEQAVSDQLGESRNSRRVMAERTMEAASAHFPTGSGLGTFVDVYRTFEDPFVPAFEYINHAHNDYLELALETGVVGILLVLAFLIWFAREALRAWRSNREGGNLARASTLVILVILLHSLVEYPVRTAALAAVFAMATAFLLPAGLRRRRSEARATTADDRSRARHLEAD